MTKNMLFIMADQLRHDFVGYAGADFVRTPNLDALAARGMVFTQCCSNAPVCVPSRTGLATGLHPVRLGHLDNHGYLPITRPTYYQQLRNHGFRVGCVGKLDLAKPDSFNGLKGDRPCTYAFGFTDPHECEGKMHAGRGNPPLGPYTHWLQSQGLLDRFCSDYRERAANGNKWRAAHDSVLPTHAFEDVYIGTKAAEWVRNAPDDFPWHYFVSFVGPHNPYDPPAEYADRYRHAEVPAAINRTGEGKESKQGSEVATEEEVALSRRQYCAAIEVIDDQIGAILAALDESGQASQTTIVFCADHGDMMGDHARWTKGRFYEGELRVPLLVAGPGIASGRCDAPVELNDLNPTVCELSGVPVLPELDARSFTSVLRGEGSTHRTESVALLRAGRCIRTPQWKLIDNANGTRELYNLESDPHELTNVASECPDVVHELFVRVVDRYLEGGCNR